MNTNMLVFILTTFTTGRIIKIKSISLRIKMKQRAKPQLQLIRDILHHSMQITAHKSIIERFFHFLILDDFIYSVYVKSQAKQKKIAKANCRLKWILKKILRVLKQEKYSSTRKTVL